MMHRDQTTQSVMVRVLDHYDPDLIASRAGGMPQEADSHAAQGICRRVSEQINQMSAVLMEADCRDCLRSIEQYCVECLNQIGALIQRGQISPWVSLRLSEKDPQAAAQDRPLRVGVYLIAANPIHWGHLAGALSAMARLRLDKIIYIIAGSDPRKPALASPRERHAIGKRLIEMFRPLFAYSPIAWGNTLPGEANLFRLLGLNRHQAMEAFYIAGTDHYRRSDPLTGQLDTIGRLEEGLQSMSPGSGVWDHSVSAVFLERHPLQERIDSFFPIHVLPPLPFSLSSTSVRSSLADPGDRNGLPGLPYEAFVQVNGYRLYNSSWPASVCDDARSQMCPFTEPRRRIESEGPTGSRSTAPVDLSRME